MLTTYFNQHSGFLKDALTPCFVRPLTVTDLETFLDLQAEIRQRLEPEQSHFLKERTREDLLEHFRSGYAALGCFVNGRLEGQLLLSVPTSYSVKNVGDYPLQLLGDSQGCMIVQSVAVRTPGQGVMLRLMEAAQILAEENGIPDLLAKVAADNRASYHGFLGAGFENIFSGQDQSGNYLACYLRKTVDPEPKLAMNGGYVRGNDQQKRPPSGCPLPVRAL